MDRPTSPNDPSGADALVVAQVLAPHGIAGELKCRIVTDFPERFQKGTRLLVGDPPVERRVRGARVREPFVYLHLEGVTDRTAAEGLRGAELLVPAAEAVSLPEGQFFWRDVIGLRVEDAEGAELGSVADILETGANDVYVVRGPGGELLIPATSEVVKAILPEEGRMVVELLPGMEPTPSRPKGGGFARRGPRRRRPARG